jgi:hypothetical protein
MNIASTVANVFRRYSKGNESIIAAPRPDGDLQITVCNRDAGTEVNRIVSQVELTYAVCSDSVIECNIRQALKDLRGEDE